MTQYSYYALRLTFFQKSDNLFKLRQVAARSLLHGWLLKNRQPPADQLGRKGESAVVTFPRDKVYDKLKECGAIPYGFHKLLAGMIIVQLLITGSINIVMWLNEKGFSAFACVIVGLSVLCIPTIVLYDSRKEWIKQYFSKNVRGFIARYWICLTETGEKVLMCDVMRRCEKISGMNAPNRPKQVGSMMIEIPLGGWFKRPRVTSLDITNDRFLGAWRVREIKGLYHRGDVQLLYSYLDNFEYEDRITLSLFDAISLLSRSADNCFRHDRYWDPASIAAELLGKERDLEEVIRRVNEDRETVVERLHARISKLDNAVTDSERKRYSILGELRNILGQINSTTRLRTTLEGAKIRVAILESLTGPSGFCAGSTYYNDLEVELPGARVELDRIEVRRRGRGSAKEAQVAAPIA